jgi:TorA maturation chaperone TorD
MSNVKSNFPSLSTASNDPIGRACHILTSVSASRANVYRWLSLGYYPPDQDLIDAVNRGQLSAELIEATTWLGADQQKLKVEIDKLASHAQDSSDVWQADYNRLFGKSIQHVSPHESSYRWREASHVLDAANSLATALKQEYNQFGLMPLDGIVDTVAVECEFLAYLCEQESQNWAIQAMSSARGLRQQQQNFLANHLGLWFPEFSRNVADCLANSFYAHLALFGNTWLSFEYGAGYLGVP